MADILKVQIEAAEKVGREILKKLPPPTLHASPGQIDPVGYRAYLQGRKSWAARDLAHSIQEYEHAVALMPNNAMPHSGLPSPYPILREPPNDTIPPTFSTP